MGDPAVTADPALQGRKAGAVSMFKVDRLVKPQDLPETYKRLRTEPNLNPRVWLGIAMVGVGMVAYYAYQNYADEVRSIERAHHLNRTDKKTMKTNAPDATN